MSRILKNKIALVAPKYNSSAEGSNYIVPNVEGVDYPIIHELGTDEFLSATVTQSGSSTMVLTGTGYNTTSIADSGYVTSPRINLIGLVEGKTYRVSGTSTLNSGASLGGDIAGHSENIPANGDFDIEFVAIAATHIAYNGKTETNDISVIATVKEITLPTASYLAYFDKDTLAHITPTLNVSTVYNLTDDHQAVFNHTAPLTATDLALLDANPNLIYDVWFNAYILPSGFAKADMGNFFGGNEGLVGEEWIQDLSVPESSTEYDPVYISFSKDIPTLDDPPAGITLNLFNNHLDTALKTLVDINNVASDITIQVSNTFAGTNDTGGSTGADTGCMIDAILNESYYVDSTGDIIGVVDIFLPAGKEFEIKCTASRDTTSIDRVGEYTLGTYGMQSLAASSAAGANTDNCIEWTVTGEGATISLTMELEAGSTFAYLNGIYITEVVTNESVEILGTYTDANRSVNQGTGASNFLIEQDASGRATDAAPANTFMFANDDERDFDTKFYPNLEKYSILEEVSGELEVLDASGIATGSQTQRRESRVITHEEGVADKLYIDTVLQSYTPALPSPTVSIKLNDTAQLGYADTITKRHQDFKVSKLIWTQAEILANHNALILENEDVLTDGDGNYLTDDNGVYLYV